MNTIAFNCKIKTKLYNGRKGFRPVNNAKLQPSKSLVPIGRGRQGIVFAVSVNPSGADPFAIKVMPFDIQENKNHQMQSSESEYKIQRTVHTACPSGVVNIYGFAKCTNFIAPSAINMANVQNPLYHDKSKQSVIFMELCTGGSVLAEFKKQSLTENKIQVILKKVCDSLHEINQKIPEFRHNDLHLDNVFLHETRGALIGDFGWSRTANKGTNPVINAFTSGGSMARRWGIGPSIDYRYDIHFFLNSAYQALSTRNFPKANAFLKSVLPLGYRGPKGAHIKSFRLKYGDPCDKFPSISTIVNHSYFKAKAASPTLSNKALLSLTAAEFLKLSPTKQAYVKALKSKGGPKKVIKSSTLVFATKPKFTVEQIQSKVIKPASVHKKYNVKVLKSFKFEKLIHHFLVAANNHTKPDPNGSKRNAARKRALAYIQKLADTNQPLFTPSPVKTPVVKKAKGIVTKAKPKASPKPKVVKVVKSKVAGFSTQSSNPLFSSAKTKASPKKSKKILINSPSNGSHHPQSRKNLGMLISPTSGRIKMIGGKSKKPVYANTGTITLAMFKEIAAKYGIDTKGKTKDEIARKLFG